MKLQFDANQEYQLKAIEAAVNVFKGQADNSGGLRFEMTESVDGYLYNSCFVVGNRLELDEEGVLENVQAVQKENGLEVSKELNGLHFSSEMETGTGKTYVYLRTIHELYKQYGFKKFVIVVPSLAIKEGVIKNLQITREYFALLYENPEMDFYVYDPRKRGSLKNFATTNSLQILVINIDSFAKFNEEKAGKNIIYQDSDWGIPIQYLQSVCPIVIVDEPQNMETPIRKKAIENLNPLCTLRYSATHKYHYNLIHKLDPVRAYDLGLVKKIEVDSVITKDSYNAAFVQVRSFKSTPKTVSAKIRIDVTTQDGIKKKDFAVRLGSDLYDFSNKREVYKDGFIINEINVANESVTFSNGTTVYAGQTQGGLTDEIMKYQISKTVKNHFEKEHRLKGKGVKVLSLFFIDRVANYREYGDGTTQKGKFAKWFEEAFGQISRQPTYKDLIPYSVESVHNGYFSQDKKGNLKDTKGNSKADDDTYALIMRDKEKLLSTDEPLRFIFSHSALREGWDNPNVFQICTLNETQSDMKKRQEIGRGLRLPVNQDGLRVFDENINILTVTANESYEDFAKTLQTEIENDCGVDFKGRVKRKENRKPLKLKKRYQLDGNFKALWDKIKHRTRYQVEYNTQTLIDKAGEAIADMKIAAPKILNRKVRINITDEGVDTDFLVAGEEVVESTIANIPDILGFIQSKTKLTKDTILKILLKSGKIADVFKNPQQFMDVATQQISQILAKMMVDGIKYEKIASKCWEMMLFENEELSGYLDNMFKVGNQNKTLYDYVLVDSEVERKFAKDLETSEKVKFYMKLPYWFKIQTPIGSYNPDWAIVFEKDKRVYFVAETKSKGQELRESEQVKIDCGRKHFENFDGVKFEAPVSEISDIAI